MSGEKLTKLILGVKGRRAKVTSVFVQKLNKCWKGHVYFRRVREPIPTILPLLLHMIPSHEKKQEKKTDEDEEESSCTAGSWQHASPDKPCEQSALQLPPPTSPTPLHLLNL